MWYRPSRWTLAAFGFAVLAGFIAWLILGRSGRTMRLADGREFSVVAVTYGTNHVLEAGPPWARLIARFGSRSMAYRFGYRSSGEYPSARPSVMIWTQWSSSNTNVPPRFASVAAANGFETEPVNARLNQTMVSNTDRLLVAWQFENYPRLQKELILRFYEYDLFHVRARHEGEVIVRNPSALARRAMLAPGIPVNATNGLLECTLVSLRCGGPPPRRPLTAKSAIAPWVTAEFEFREDGQPTTDWTVKRMEAFGATGNYFSGDRLVVELEEGRRVARFTGAFWQDEVDWRLVAHVAATRNFPAESLWTVRLRARDFLSGTLTTNLQAEARGLSHFRLAVGLENADRRDEASERIVAFLRANFTPSAPDLHVDLARAVDDQGRELRVTPALVPRTGACEAKMELPASVQHVDFTFAIHRSRKLEFRVRPVLVSTNAQLNKP